MPADLDRARMRLHRLLAVVEDSRGYRHLVTFQADPARTSLIDIVAAPDPTAPGGTRYHVGLPQWGGLVEATIQQEREEETALRILAQLGESFGEDGT